MSLGALIRAKRDMLGLSLADLASDTGISKAHLHHLENDRSDPGLLTCVKLAVALGISVQQMATAALSNAMKKEKP